ncbi:MAG: hypothetical protein JNL47_08675 [Bacteroidia bacterium]|nr:hypothetical protein [Bacteroidia bacterium]
MTKKTIILILLIAASNSLFAQKGKINYSRYCSKLIAQVSNEWRMDSLGKNNFRSKFVQRFMKARIDSVSISQVRNNLGPPNNTWVEPGKIMYVYYFFSMKHNAGWLYAEYLVFTFNTETSLLLSISQGDNDRG